MIPEIVEVIKNVKFIIVDRDIDFIKKSLGKTDWGWSEDVIYRLLKKRDEDLKNISSELILRIKFEDLLNNPEYNIRSIIEFCGISDSFF